VTIVLLYQLSELAVVSEYYDSKTKSAIRRIR